MRYSLAPVALAALVSATPVPQGVSSAISPEGSAPAGCQTTYPGTFNIQIVNVSDSSASKRSVKRQANILAISLTDGTLTDSEGRTGYVAANQQFQFDSPPQTGAIYTSGFSVCSNGSLALGDNAIWYSCLSGDFYNLYETNEAAQCNPVYIEAIGSSSGGAASVQSDGQPTGSAVAQQSDGQPTGTAVAPVSQITDGQIQATSAAAVSQISDGQIQATTAAPVSQISDGQIQATTAAAVSQISDGQIQATTAGAVSQISDGQIQATPVSPVTQITDGQIQAPTGTAPVTQISDGQIQAPTANGTSGYASPSVSVQAQIGAAAPVQIGSGLGLVAAIFGLAML